MTLDTLARTVYTEDHEAFRQSVRSFIKAEVDPHSDRWDEAGIVDKAIWPKAGAVGMLCPTVPEEYGGLGLDFGYNAIIDEEVSYGGTALGFSLQSDIVVNYIVSYGSEEQKRHWLPKLVSGEVVTAIAMTEPGTGSDLQGIRTTAKKDGNHYVINGSKTYITNGQNADLILVCAKTDTEVQPAWKGVSIILVEAEREGFKRGRNLDKIGQDAADTSELFFEDVRVPMTNCLGEEGKGFVYLMSELPQERLSIAIGAQASAQRAYDETVNFVRDRKAFGKPVIDFQNTRFTLADLKTKLQVGWAHLDWALARHLKKELTAEEGAAAKLWHTEFQWEMMDKCLQLHGGAGYMNEYPIAKMWRGARVTRIFGGTNEIMKELIGASFNLKEVAIAVTRTTVDLAEFPDLVVIYLGMRVNSLGGLGRLFRLGPQIRASVDTKPDGLLAHEDLFFSILPLHVGFRQYWRDLESMMVFTKAQMHDGWWQEFLRDPGGTGFWHETYCRTGGIEAVYDDMPAPVGMGRFAPLVAAKGPMLSARTRLERAP